MVQSLLETKYLCILYFDERIGPNFLYCQPSKPDDKDFPDLFRILEFSEELGSFLFSFRRYQSINHLFRIFSEMARGGSEFLMISFLLRTSFFKYELGDVYNYLNSKVEILEDFGSQLMQLPNFNLILHSHKKDPDEADLNILCKEYNVDFFPIFNHFFNKLVLDPEINIITKDSRIKRKIFIIGQKNAGKRIFLKNIEAIQFYKQKDFNLSTRIFSVLIENIKIPSPKIDLNSSFDLDTIQAFIYLFKNGKEDNIKKLKEDIEKIIINIADKTINFPILIIENISEGERSLEEYEVYNYLKLSEEQKKIVKVQFYSLNILKDDDEIIKALKWLTLQII